MHTPAAVIFDLDGTLIDSRGDIVAAANHALVATGLAEDLRLAQHHLDHADELPPDWQDAAEFSTYGLLVTVDEVAELVAAIDALARPLRAAVRRTAPPGARAVRLVVDAFARTDLG